MTRASNRMLRNRQLAQKRRTVLWTPGKLFTTGVNGAWYDPSDMTTLFQDAAGTTPVTAVEQPVGKMLDKSKGLVLGPELVTNGDLSSSTGWTLTTGWSVSGGYLIQDGTGGGAVYNGTSVVGRWYQYSITVVDTITGGAGATYLNVGGATVAILYNGTPGKTYTGIVYSTGTRAFECNNGGSAHVVKLDNISVRELPGNHAFNSSGNSANFPVLSARYNLLTKSEHILDASIGQYLTTKISNTSWTFAASNASRLYWSLAANLAVGVSYRLSATFSAADVGKKIRFAYYDTGYNISPTDIIIDSNGYAEWVFTAVANTGIVSIYSASTGGAITYTFASSKGFSCTVANDALNQPAYQRVNTPSDYDTVGFKPYLKFNGVNQWLQTSSIDFTSTDKMFVSAGVRKLLGTSSEMLVELGPNLEANNGSFGLLTGLASYNSYAIGLRGVVSSLYTYAYYPPTPGARTDVVVGNLDLAKDPYTAEIGFRLDSNPVTPSGYLGNSSAGTGNFGNYPLYIGARAGTTVWFNGRIYQLVVAGKQVTDTELLQTEDYMELKTFNKDMGYVYNYLVDANGNPVTDASGNPIYVSATYQ